MGHAGVVAVTSLALEARIARARASRWCFAIKSLHLAARLERGDRAWRIGHHQFRHRRRAGAASGCRRLHRRLRRQRRRRAVIRHRPRLGATPVAGDPQGHPRRGRRLRCAGGNAGAQGAAARRDAALSPSTWNCISPHAWRSRTAFPSPSAASSSTPRIAPCRRRPPSACAPDGTPDLRAVIRSLLRNPTQLPDLIRTARDAEVAESALFRARQHLGAGLGIAEERGVAEEQGVPPYAVA